MITIRFAQPADASTVGGLLHAFNIEFDAPTPSAQEFTSRFTRLLARDDVLVVLAHDEGAATGFGYLTLRPTPYGDGPLAQLEELYVVPHRRDEGIGTLVLRAAVDEVKRRGAIEVHINVDEIDTDTRRFYERHGFSNLEPGANCRMLCYVRELMAQEG